MIVAKKEGVLMEKTKLPFENAGVLNPAVFQDGNTVHLFYRAVQKGNISTIGYCKLNGPLTIEHRNTSPVICSENDYESHGVEDPRIVKIEDTYYLSYVAYDGVNALGALATSKDLINWEKKGIIVAKITFDEFEAITKKHKLNQKYGRYNAQIGVIARKGDKVLLWDKDLVLFPRKINEKFVFIHRIKPDIQIVKVDKFEDLNDKFWKDYFSNISKNILMKPRYSHECSYIGGGCPPIETEKGWLLIYHGVTDTVNGYVYSACASLLDLKNPTKEIARLPYPLFSPESKWELEGQVDNVCFPTGTALFDDKLYIYYGAADKRIGVASVNLSELLKELMNNTLENEKYNDKLKS